MLFIWFIFSVDTNLIKLYIRLQVFNGIYSFASYMQSTKRFQHDDDNIGIRGETKKKVGNIKETTENKRSQFVILFFS